MNVTRKEKGGIKMKCRKIKILLSVLLLLCVSISSISVLAADERVGEIVDGSLLTENSGSESIVNSALRGVFLSYGTGTISNPSGRTVSVDGRTVCYTTCDKVKVTLHLQKLVGNSWSTIATVGPKTATNAYTVSASNSYTVTGGYYYRVKGAHTAIDDGSTETVTSFTDGIWIE